MLEIGQPFPAFALKDQNDKSHSLADYAGHWLVIYFYPKDNSGTCTIEALDFTSMAAKFKVRKAVVIGVSPDSVKSHSAFIAKKNLKLVLLSDPDHALLEAAGVWQSKMLYGRQYMGVVRTTAVVDPEGMVREHWVKVKVPGHVQDVLERLIELQKMS